MLRLFRKHPDVIPAPDWAERITNIIDDYDLGVCLSVTSLITALAQQYPEAFMLAIPKAIMRLHKVQHRRLNHFNQQGARRKEEETGSSQGFY
jgi:AP-2 complex subunit alpha